MTELLGHIGQLIQSQAPPPAATPPKPPDAIPMPNGMVEQGNIDVNHRPTINNADGSHSTIFSATIPLDEKGNPWPGDYEKAPRYALVPTIVDGKFLTADGKMPDQGNRRVMEQLEDSARDYYAKTHQHLGIFTAGKSADDYAAATHAYMPSGTPDKVYIAPPTKNGPLK